MGDLISRSELLDTLAFNGVNIYGHDETLIEAAAIVRLIKDFQDPKRPANRHGEWLNTSNGEATCSRCGRRTGHYDDDSIDRYCSHCGSENTLEGEE